MYLDYPPHRVPVDQVLVVEKKDGVGNADEVIDRAPSTIDGDGDTVYWIVFADEPRTAAPYTESALRASL